MQSEKTHLEHLSVLKYILLFFYGLGAFFLVFSCLHNSLGFWLPFDFTWVLVWIIFLACVNTERKSDFHRISKNPFQIQCG